MDAKRMKELFENKESRERLAKCDSLENFYDVLTKEYNCEITIDELRDFYKKCLEAAHSEMDEKELDQVVGGVNNVAQIILIVGSTIIVGFAIL